jgi:YD repeat-containing protein
MSQFSGNTDPKCKEVVFYCSTKQVYFSDCSPCKRLIYSGNSWQVKTTDGWTYIFPYRPQALMQNVTVLTGFIDPTGQKYEMERDSFGALMSISRRACGFLQL